MSERSRTGQAGETRSALRRLEHEMRTPLSQIIGYAEMVQEEAEDRAQPDLVPDLERIQQAARTLLDVVAEICRPEGTAVEGPDAPLHEPADGHAATEPAAPGEARAGRVLVVDDDARNRDLLARRLERQGYTARTAENGREALARIGDEDFDLVLLDVVMPEMDGFQVLQAIRRMHAPAELPVIMATGLDRSQDTVAALRLGANDYVTKPFDFPVVFARVETQLSLGRATRMAEVLARQLEIRTAFLRKMLGRYISDEVVSELLESEEGLELGGEKRTVSILISDLRGFSSLTQTLAPLDVVALLNNHLGTMAEVVQQHDGVVAEFIGDAVLAFFGAPLPRPDHAERAVACGVAMQVAMDGVNDRNRSRGLPAIEMGVGVATGDVVLGNIGSQTRAKYGVVGSPVNLAARIESYTLGGEVLICEQTLDRTRADVRIDMRRRVHPKGLESPIHIHRVRGMEGAPDLTLPEGDTGLRELSDAVLVSLAILEGKDVGNRRCAAHVWSHWAGGIKVRSKEPIAEMNDVRIEIPADDSITPCYAKVVEHRVTGDEHLLTLRFSAEFETLRVWLSALPALTALPARTDRTTPTD